MDPMIAQLKVIVPDVACHNILSNLHPNFLTYFTGSFRTENEWGYNYFVSGDAWYWYNIYNANNTYSHLTIEAQRNVNLRDLFKNPGNQLEIFKKASLKSIMPLSCKETLESLHPDLMEYVTNSFKSDNEWAYDRFIGGDVYYWYNLYHANIAYKELSRDVQMKVNKTNLFKNINNFQQIFKMQ